MVDPRAYGKNPPLSDICPRTFRHLVKGGLNDAKKD
jgi:hypothetical protein